MATALLPKLDLTTFPGSAGGLSLTSIAHIGQAFLVADRSTYADLLAWVLTHVTTLTISIDVSALTSAAEIRTLLDAGVTRAFATLEQLAELRSGPGRVDDTRLVLVLDMTHSKEKIIDTIAETPLGVYAKDVQDLEFVTGWLKEYGKDNRPPVFVSFGYEPGMEDVRSIAELVATPIIDAGLLTVDLKSSGGGLSVAEVICAAAATDRADGLLTTLVVDERGVGLGLVYSSQASVSESLRTGRGVYQSRKRGLWYKGETSGAVQELVKIDLDCDGDCLRFVVRQKGSGFCHLETATCYGDYKGLSKLQKTLISRKETAVEGSYTTRLFSDEKLLRAKIMEEAQELCEAKTKEDVAFEAADLFYFALTRCIAAGVTLEDVERSLDAKSLKVTRRKGDAKGLWAEKEGTVTSTPAPPPPAPSPATEPGPAEDGPILMKRFDATKSTPEELDDVIRRPAQKTHDIMGIVTPIIDDVRARGDTALLHYAARFDLATTLTSAVIKAPFPPELMALSPETTAAIDLSFENIRKFHAAQADKEDLVIETMPGVKCSRFTRPIERVGLYIPGGTAVLPSTALMLGVPAMVAGCSQIVLASPPRPDGSITPEIVYVAHKVGASAIVLAGGAQAVAALAYGTQSVPKVDKILGPGNQFVTAAKMYVSNDTRAAVSIDMPAGPSEVLVIADATANPAFVASDLLSQAEHGVDSQVILIAVDLNEDQLSAIESELHNQALTLPRCAIVRGSISHSVTLQTDTLDHALTLSNTYAPEHLILQIANPSSVLPKIMNAGSVFVGAWTPESVGDYSAGVNHSLPTYGYARQYSGVNLATYVKHVTASELTEEGLRNVGGAVMELARVEELEAHRRAVEVRLKWADERV
ncbi:tri-functional histidine biosynthesis protein [Terfezia boudieri ATCC MYA-4762]|uniref:Histidine biosynthesis trifunctional protein n=1 Tax=Terfezia boudieri ATCC MYA-4762 TaxID=1051890 RepID=A0A3N4LWT9_9PEZI|nr:tri-functional histidine biosynthesis protein [Terfezia boudieri ATCC MYA-4762]